MTVKFKKLSEEAVMPVRAHKEDAGIDLTVTKISTELNEARQLTLVYHTDIAVEIPEGYVGLLLSRSSICNKSLIQTNCCGVIDSNYRGELIVKFRSTTDAVPAIYNPGDKFAQLVIVPFLQYEVEEAEELSATERGTNGFGSTDTAEKEVERSSASTKVASEQAAGDQDTPEQAQ